MSKTIVLRPQKPQSPSWDQIIPLWLHGRPESTVEVYKPIIEDFREFVGSKPVGAVTLKDLQDYQDTFLEQKPATVKRKLATVKSLLGFAYKTGMIPFNVGVALRSPKVPDQLADRILTEADVQKMIKCEPNPRNQVLMRVMYNAGIRASETSGLKWRDVQPREKGGQITVLGKGSKTRSIRLSEPVWKALQKIRKDAAPEQPVFRIASGKAMSRFHITIAIRAAARRAGIPAKASAHWLRHTHATVAMEHGAPLALIQSTLGHSNLAVTSRYIHARPDQSSSQFLSA